jgi:hypothetical protein
LEKELEKSGDKDKPKPFWDVRNSARGAMRKHEAFLGGTHEMGLALQTPDWTPKMPCYLCSAMMGYQTPKRWRKKHRRKYDTEFS